MKTPKPWYRKSKNAWFACINGKQVMLAKSEKKAQEKLQRLLHNGPDCDYAIRQIVQLYWTWMKSNLAETTCKRRKTILESFSASVTSSLKASQLKAFHVQKWIDSCKLVRSPTTAGDYIARIKAMMNWAVGMGYADSNPVQRMPKPSPRIREEFVPPDVWQKVLDLATDEPFRDYVTVLLVSGARPSEMHTFEASHFIDGRFVLPISRSKGRKKSRVVYLPGESLKIVKRLVKKHPTGKLFRNSDGNPWNKDNVRCRFRRMKKKLGMPTLCATTLRHSFAHYRLTSGQDVLTVSKLMGHSDTRMLATRYGHIDANVEYMKGAANAVPFPQPPGTSSNPAA